ncbi:MAG: UDP-N-acetylmuramate:L-alanyl-gamma-D-glutamyl-meso-diaminopimelate ligase [Gammaproteobacteria bacterium]|nr:UDP-N-acetylmuramate:L-alanyl-gamma-D-glutamyl-meso-diaminopimelate ligase [Gammaproteobacteria bacterium]
MHLHILGICGTLMGSIALLARELGYQVSGCDENVYPPMSTQLENAGIRLSSPYSAENIAKDADLILIGNAGLPRGNPAVEAVLDQGLPYTSGAEWLGRYALQDRWVIAVAGTHGKTTTSSMIAWIMDYASLNPGFLIGGVPSNFSESARMGSAPFFVIEADEYDTSYFDRRSKFLHYRPRTAVLNNLEYDHADIFPDLAAIQNQFHLLLRTIPGTGLIIHPNDDESLQTVFDQGCWTPRLSFANDLVNDFANGITNDEHYQQATFCAHLLEEDASHFKVTIDGRDCGVVQWCLTGRHNMNNALAAIAAARHAGVKPQLATEALCEFIGVKRRMEVILDTTAVRVYDDFAHHPSAIASTLDGLRKQVGDEQILAIIEPASHTMKKGTHETILAQSAEHANQIIWFEPPSLSWDFASAVSSPTARVTRDKEDIITWAIQFASQSQPVHIVIMSNGSFGGLHTSLVKRLQGIQ